MTRLFKILLSNRPLTEIGKGPRVEEPIEVKADSMLLIKGFLTFSSAQGLVLAKYPFERVRNIKIERPEEVTLNFEIALPKKAKSKTAKKKQPRRMRNKK